MQRRLDDRQSVGITRADCRRETHAAAPTLRRFGMETTKNYPSFSNITLNRGSASIGILANDCPPAVKPWAILPVLVQSLAVSRCNRNDILVNVPIHIRIEIERYARSQVQAFAI